MNKLKQKSTSCNINERCTPMNHSLNNVLTYATSNYKVFPLKLNKKPYSFEMYKGGYLIE